MESSAAAGKGGKDGGATGEQLRVFVGNKVFETLNCPSLFDVWHGFTMVYRFFLLYAFGEIVVLCCFARLA